MNRLLVIGATGYVGKSLFAESKKSFSTIGTSSKPEQGFCQFNLEFPDNFDYQAIAKNDVIIITAAISSPDICSGEYEYAWRVNVEGTSTFIENTIAKGANIIFFSSDTVYGERNEPFDETALCNPAGDYAKMKNEVEMRFLGNPQFKSVRLSYVFSSEDKFTRYLNHCASTGEDAEIFHPFYRAVIHRNDVINGALALAERWEEFSQPIFNFGGPETIARTDFAQTLKELALPNLKYRISEPNADFFENRPRAIRMTSTTLPALLGYNPRTLAEAIKLEFNLTGQTT